MSSRRPRRSTARTPGTGSGTSSCRSSSRRCFFLAVIETTASFQIFDLVYTMTGGGPARASYSLVYQIYDQGFKYFDLGYASTLGVALFIITIVVALVQRRLIGRDK